MFHAVRFEIEPYIHSYTYKKGGETMNERALRLVQHGTARKHDAYRPGGSAHPVAALPVGRVVGVQVVSHRPGHGVINGPRRQSDFCSGLPRWINKTTCLCGLVLGVVAGLFLWLLIVHKDPTVKFEKFEIIDYDYAIFPPSLTLQWDCHLLVDNTESPLPIEIDDTKVYLYYGTDLVKTVDVKAFKLRAGKAENVLVSDKTKFNLLDVGFLKDFITDWATKKDCKFFLKTKLPVRAIFFEAEKDVSCESVIKGQALLTKPKMTCDTED